MLEALAAIPVWVILMLVATNLLGFVVRGLAEPNEVREIDGLIPGEARRCRLGNAVVTGGFFLLALAFMYALVHYWNAPLAVAAGLLMLARLPDLLWEMRHGVWGRQAAASLPKGGVHGVLGLLAWVALPVIWYSLRLGHR